MREVGETGWMHIIIRGINRENLFYDEADYSKFASTIERVRRETGCEIAAFCLMANHIHLLLYEEQGAHSQLIKRLLISYAAYYNKKYDRVGHVFQDRFRSEPINDEQYLLTVARYIFRNPEKAGICPAEEYPYTTIQTDGVLSGYFSSQEELSAFLKTENEDRCLEYDSTYSFSDADTINLLTELTGERNPQLLQEFDRVKRDEIIRELKSQGATVRQISRLTGLNRNIVQRA